jgi:hypothetical protein
VGHVVHSGASGVRNIYTLFSCSSGPSSVSIKIVPRHVTPMMRSTVCQWFGLKTTAMVCEWFGLKIGGDGFSWFVFKTGGGFLG